MWNERAMNDGKEWCHARLHRCDKALIVQKSVQRHSTGNGNGNGKTNSKKSCLLIYAEKCHEVSKNYKVSQSLTKSHGELRYQKVSRSINKYLEVSKSHKVSRGLTKYHEVSWIFKVSNSITKSHKPPKNIWVSWDFPIHVLSANKVVN